MLIGYRAGYGETVSNKLFIDNSGTSSPLIERDFANDILGINGALMAHGNTNIYVTSFADTHTLNRARETMPNGYVVKPFDEKDIYPSIEIALFNVQKQIQPEFSRAFFNEKLNVSLTEKEFEIVEDIIIGITNPQIAENIISENTLKPISKTFFQN